MSVATTEQQQCDLEDKGYIILENFWLFGISGVDKKTPEILLNPIMKRGGCGSLMGRLRKSPSRASAGIPTAAGTDG